MKTKRFKWLVLFAAVGVITLLEDNTDFPLGQRESLTKITTAVGDPTLLQERYEAWKRQRDQSMDSRILQLQLVSPNTHSATPNGGRITLNVETGVLNAIVHGIAPGEPLTLWATQNAHLYSTKEASHDLEYLGQFRRENKRWILEKNISPLLRSGYKIGQLIVAPNNTNPLHNPVFAASPSLFERLLAAELNAQSGKGVLSSIIPAAQATAPTGFPDVFNDLVTQGEDIFFNEAFDGNSRSCGTCHPATENFTIDTNFIASLPPTDPLFVAEFIPALIFGNPANLDSAGNPRRFENPALMRGFGLIVENQDGFGDLENRFNMRSVGHNIGMTVSVATPPEGLTPPDDRTGWGGDGAPSGIVGGIAASGRVRDFMLGAIVQHYPLTTNRSFTGPNPDFRAPTLGELDALEAFLFSVGRQSELQLDDGFPDTLVLKNSGAEAGKILFRDGVGSGVTCNGCHSNAGANVNGGTNPGNRNFNTGVELFLRNRINDSDFTIPGEPRPVDGGFGTNPAGDFTSLVEQPGFVNENFGDMTFNAVSLVEAADTAPFFHNNIADTLEEAIAFYNSPEFIQSIGAGIPFNRTQISQVANFLRVINALDNVENAVLRQSDRALLALGQAPVPNDVITRILQIMIADTNDAIEVLNQGNLHNSGGLPFNAVRQLERARKRMQQAMNTDAATVARTNHIQFAQDHLANAVALMRF